MEKTRPKNSTIKPFSTLSVLCMKIQGGHGHGPPLPTPIIVCQFACSQLFGVMEICWTCHLLI